MNNDKLYFIGITNKGKKYLQAVPIDKITQKQIRCAEPLAPLYITQVDKSRLDVIQNRINILQGTVTGFITQDATKMEEYYSEAYRLVQGVAEEMRNRAQAIYDSVMENKLEE